MSLSCHPSQFLPLGSDRPRRSQKKPGIHVAQQKKQVLGTGAAVNVTIWLFNIAMENGPFIDDLPIKNGDFPWLC